MTASLREAGFYPLGGRHRVYQLIANCVHCRMLRQPTMTQQMADLPEQRLYRTPPFYHCGIDVFGHFTIRQGKPTRANSGIKKVWVLLFKCLYSQAVHMEILDSMDKASFRMAFQCFVGLRGNCAYLRSDGGTNFMGARNEEQEEWTR